MIPAGTAIDCAMMLGSAALFAAWSAAVVGVLAVVSARLARDERAAADQRPR